MEADQELRMLRYELRGTWRRSGVAILLGMGLVWDLLWLLEYAYNGQRLGIYLSLAVAHVFWLTASSWWVAKRVEIMRVQQRRQVRRAVRFTHRQAVETMEAICRVHTASIIQVLLQQVPRENRSRLLRALAGEVES